MRAWADERGMWKRFCSGLIDLMSPPRCAGCEGVLHTRALAFCDACLPLLEPAPHDGDDLHRDGYAYGGPLRDALHRLKYDGASELGRVLGALLRETVLPLTGKVDAVTAVPLHPRRLRERGYNQSLLLARPLARALSVPLVPGLLRRVRDTPAQVGKSRAERQVQLNEAICPHRDARGRRLLVVDDVRTTGATLAAACSALERAGAVSVYTVALAGAPDDDVLS
jgi:ComF family protein